MHFLGPSLFTLSSKNKEPLVVINNKGNQFFFFLSGSQMMFFKYNLLSLGPTYSVYGVLLVSGVDSRDSSLTYNTQ